MFGLKGKKELEALNREIEMAKLELRRVDNNINASKEELDKINTDISKALEGCRRAEQDFRDLDVETRCKKFELEGLEKQINEYKKEMSIYKEEIRSLKLQRESEMKLEIKIRDKKAELEQIEKELKEIEEGAEGKVKEVEARCQGRIDELSYELKSKSKKLEEIKEEMSRIIIEKDKAYNTLCYNIRETQRLSNKIEELKKKEFNLEEERAEVVQLREEKEELEKAIAEYNAKDTINVSSIAEVPRHEFANSSFCKDALEDVRNNQKVMIENGTAIISSKDWVVGGSKIKGRKMVSDTIKMMLKSFNNGSDYIIGSLKYATYTSSKNKLDKLFKDINRLNEVNAIRISKDYYDLKMEELELAFRYAEMKEEEKEEQRRVREQMREEAKRQEEIEEMKKRIEKEQKHYENELERALEKEKDAELIRKLRERIAELEESKKDVKKLEATVKAGYVYIISNEGSFGEDVYKIGTTRRLNPFDRVDELGNASVPFKFDVHGMIFSEDCFELEAKLHKIFDAKRVNKVNKRKEFFNVSLDEIVAVVNDKLGLNVEFTMEAIAKDYREGMMLD